MDELNKIENLTAFIMKFNNFCKEEKVSLKKAPHKVQLALERYINIYGYG